MQPEELLEQVRAQLRAAATPGGRASILRFFKEPVDPYGVLTPQVRKIASAACKDIKSWPAAQRNRFCVELWKSGKLEEGNVALEVCHRFHKRCGACEFHLFEKWIDRFVRNWAHCDALCGWLIAAALQSEPELAHSLVAWTKSPNRWKRRAAVVSLVREAKMGRNLGIILEVAALLLDDEDEMVQKGVGWLLKETYPKQPREVVAFLAAHRSAPRLVLRYAAEKMNAKDRAAVL